MNNISSILFKTLKILLMIIAIGVVVGVLGFGLIAYNASSS
ncbi:MAG: hypothetical protein VW522_09290 [Candidatus Neomarinimicrobiota bacterium]